MNPNFVRRARWRELDLAQIHLWPNSTRRWTLVGLGIVVVLFGVWVGVWPRYQKLVLMRAEIQSYQVQVQNIYGVPVPAATEGSSERDLAQPSRAWMTDLAVLARRHGLSEVQIKAQILDAGAQVRLREYAQRALGAGSGAAAAVPVSWGQGSVLAQVEVQGSYSDVLAFVAELGHWEAWLGIVEVNMSAVLDEAGQPSRVKWEAGLWYRAQE